MDSAGVPWGPPTPKLIREKALETSLLPGRVWVWEADVENREKSYWMYEKMGWQERVMWIVDRERERESERDSRREMESVEREKAKIKDTPDIDKKEKSEL